MTKGFRSSRSAIWPLALLALASCQFVPGSEASKIAEARAEVGRQLKDADAAKFRNLVVAPLGHVVCGEVNGKNEFGAYTGFRPFAYRVEKKVALIFPTDNSTPEDRLAAIEFPKGCLNQPS